MFFGRPKKRALRVYFATDIHGSERCFRKFLAAADSYEADALVLGGDIPGNDDPTAIDPVLREAPRIESPEGELYDLGPVLLASCGDVTPTPWKTEREYPEDVLEGRLSAILDKAPPDSKMVVNFHNPPYGSGLDFASELDAELRPVIRGGRPSIVPVGSKAVREVIKRYKPVVGLHGHIHESKAAQKIGPTLCLNPGSDYSSDVLRGAIVDFAQDG